MLHFPKSLKAGFGQMYGTSLDKMEINKDAAYILTVT